MLYFAYGSNLDPEQLLARCGDEYTFVTVARLQDFALAFTRCSPKRGGGVADVIPTEGKDVWGVVFDITAAYAECLDRYEGVRHDHYHREDVQVLGKDDRPSSAMTYVVSPKQDRLKPSPAYIKQIVRGAIYWELPPAYIESLQGLA